LSNVARVDLATHLVNFRTTVARAAEGAGTGLLTVDLSGPAAAPVSVTYLVAPQTARGRGQDFALASGALDFAPGERTRTITVSGLVRRASRRRRRCS